MILPKHKNDVMLFASTFYIGISRRWMGVSIKFPRLSGYYADIKIGYVYITF